MLPAVTRVDAGWNAAFRALHGACGVQEDAGAAGRCFAPLSSDLECGRNRLENQVILFRAEVMLWYCVADVQKAILLNPRHNLSPSECLDCTSVPFTYYCDVQLLLIIIDSYPGKSQAAIPPGRRKIRVTLCRNAGPRNAFSGERKGKGGAREERGEPPFRERRLSPAGAF